MGREEMRIGYLWKARSKETTRKTKKYDGWIILKLILDRM
jgi:hypothetical protein